MLLNSRLEPFCRRFLNAGLGKLKFLNFALFDDFCMKISDRVFNLHTAQG
ncbi:MAG: hypothetical protein ACREPR_14485 [Brasilonema sp.]